MWLSFFLGALACVVILYVPGFFILRSLNMSKLSSFICAPMVTIVASCGLSIIYLFADINCSFWSIVVPLTGLGAIACLLRGLIKRQKCLVSISDDVDQGGKNSRLWLASYVGLAVLVVGWFFVRTLDSAASIYQENDCYYHLNLIRSFIDTGFYYGTQLGTYPKAWHNLVALCISFTNIDLSVAVNAVNFVLMSIVYPSGMYLFLQKVFSDRPSIIHWGALCTVAFAAFPWGFLVFGPLYPNLAGYSLLPIAMYLFVSLIETSLLRNRILYAILFFVSCIGLALLHPSAVFVGVVLLTPYCVHAICCAVNKRNVHLINRHSDQLIFSSLFVLVIVGFWIVLFNLPAFAGTVWFEWDAFSSKSQAVISALTLSFTVASAPQYILAVFVFMGVLYCLFMKRYRWILVSYLIVLIMYVINASTDGFLKHLLTGFWYTDSFRIAAMAAIAAIPLAAIGLHAFSSLCKKAILLVFDDEVLKKRIIAGISVLLTIVFLGVNYCPNFEIRHNVEITTGFGIVQKMLQDGNNMSENVLPYDGEERKFVDEVKQSIPEDAVVINLPYDGSIYSYALNELTIYYQVWYGYGASAESSENALLREHLCDVSTRDDVREVLEEKNIEYVLLLDQGRTEGSGLYQAPFEHSLWSGITNITDETPGFEIVLSEGDMRLYKITAV